MNLTYSTMDEGIFLDISLPEIDIISKFIGCKAWNTFLKICVVQFLFHHCYIRGAVRIIQNLDVHGNLETFDQSINAALTMVPKNLVNMEHVVQCEKLDPNNLACAARSFVTRAANNLVGDSRSLDYRDVYVKLNHSHGPYFVADLGLGNGTVLESAVVQITAHKLAERVGNSEDTALDDHKVNKTNCSIAGKKMTFALGGTNRLMTLTGTIVDLYPGKGGPCYHVDVSFHEFGVPAVLRFQVPLGNIIHTFE